MIDESAEVLAAQPFRPHLIADSSRLGLAPVLCQPLVAQPSKVARAFEERRHDGNDSGKQDNSNVNPEHRPTSQGVGV